MVNGMMPWGNKQLLPLGPLREPLIALSRADIVIIHHADLASIESTSEIELVVRNIKASLPIILTRMVLSHFFNLRNITCQMPLRSVHNTVVLCVSGIGFASAFVQGIKMLGPLHVDQLDFSDHHQFLPKDMHLISTRLCKLQAKFGFKPIVVITEKDYDREPELFKQLDPFEVLVLCSQLQVVSRKGQAEDCYMLLTTILKEKLSIKNST